MFNLSSTVLQSFPQIPSHVALAVLQALGQHITLRCQAVSADLRALITHLALRVMLWTMALSYHSSVTTQQLLETFLQQVL